LGDGREVVGVPLVGGGVGRAAGLAGLLQLGVVLAEELHVHGLDERRLVLLGVVGDVDLLELGLLLGQLDALLLHVAVGGLPRVVVLDEALGGLPRKELRPDLAKVLAQLVEGLLEQVGLGRRPVLDLVLADQRPLHRHQPQRGLAQVVARLVQNVQRVQLNTQTRD